MMMKDLPRAPSAIREFDDGAGQRWTVRQFTPSVPSTLLTAAHADGWLTFERGDGERRRLVPAPPGWEARSDGGLRDLLGAARPVARAEDLPGFGWLTERGQESDAGPAAARQAASAPGTDPAASGAE